MSDDLDSRLEKPLPDTLRTAGDVHVVCTYAGLALNGRPDGWEADGVAVVARWEGPRLCVAVEAPDGDDWLARQNGDPLRSAPLLAAIRAAQCRVFPDAGPGTVLYSWRRLLELLDPDGAVRAPSVGPVPR